MRKSDIVAHVAERVSLSKVEAQGAVNALLDAVRDALASGERVSLPGFGTFSTKNRPARRGRNPRTGESIDVPASKAPSFRAGKTFATRFASARRGSGGGPVRRFPHGSAQA